MMKVTNPFNTPITKTTAAAAITAATTTMTK